MRSIVPGALFDALPAAGVACLRLNFRGVGESQGEYDEGRGERADVVAGVDVLHPIVEGVPVVLAGWSFGADTSLAVGDDRVAGWFAVAPPLRVVEMDDVVAASDPRPKLLVVPEHDQFRPPDSAREVTDGWNNTRIEVVRGADHFLVGRVDRLPALCVDLLKELG
jgi:uncharacterized protein